MPKSKKPVKNIISEEAVQELVNSCNSGEEIESLAKGLLKKVTETVLEAEMSQQLGYAKHDPSGNNTGNSRNGKTTKTMRSVHGEVEIDTPRDRNGEFEPKLVKKGQRDLGYFGEKAVSLYSKGMSTRDIQAHLMEAFDVDVSAEYISHLTNKVKDEAHAWQNRPLEDLYPVVFMDALRVRTRSSGSVQNRCVYLSLGINKDGEKELLGMWMSETEGAKFWLSVMNDLKNRGVQRIYIACVDGLKGFPEAIEAAFPQTRVQLCIVHQIRHSLRYVGFKQRKEVAAWLKRIYAAATLEEAEQALKEFAERWDGEHPSISRSWRNNWDGLTVFFDFPPEIRKVIYTTNAIESLNASLRKATKNRRVFPNDESVMKVLYLALHQITKKWTMPIRDWKPAMNQFIIMYGE